MYVLACPKKPRQTCTLQNQLPQNLSPDPRLAESTAAESKPGPAPCRINCHRVCPTCAMQIQLPQIRGNYHKCSSDAAHICHPPPTCPEWAGGEHRLVQNGPVQGCRVSHLRSTQSPHALCIDMSTKIARSATTCQIHPKLRVQSMAAAEMMQYRCAMRPSCQG